MVNNAIFVILPVKGMAKNGRGWCHCFPNELNADFFSEFPGPKSNR